MKVDGRLKVFNEEDVMRALSKDVQPLFPVRCGSAGPARVAINGRVRRWKRRQRFTDAMCGIIAHTMTLDNQRLRERVDEIWLREALEEFET